MRVIIDGFYVECTEVDWSRTNPFLREVILSNGTLAWVNDYEWRLLTGPYSSVKRQGKEVLVADLRLRGDYIHAIVKDQLGQYLVINRVEVE